LVAQVSIVTGSVRDSWIGDRQPVGWCQDGQTTLGRTSTGVHELRRTVGSGVSGTFAVDADFPNLGFYP
jgi:hypothetical protein